MDVERLARLIAQYGKLREFEGTAQMRERDGLAARERRKEASTLYAAIVRQLQAAA